MATYKEIKGVTVQTLDSDPVLGGVAGATWAAGTAVNTARTSLMSSKSGTQSAYIIAGGTPPANPRLAITESWNGSSWTEVNDLNTGRSESSSVGTSTAALTAGGGTAPGSPNNTNVCETWNGSSWTEVNDLNTTRREADAAGTYTAALQVSGAVGPPQVANVESWNGSSWTETTDVNTTRANASVIGTQTANIFCAGSNASTGYTALTEQWDGSSWTEVGDLNTARDGLKGFGADYTSAVVAGGGIDPGNVAVTEFWNGSAWTEVADLSAARRAGAAAGIATAGAYATGQPHPNPAVEEFSAAPPTASILTEGSLFLSKGTTLKGFGRAAGIPAATFSSGGTLNNGHGYGGGFGLQTAAICAAGGYPTETTNTENYNGTSWTEVNNLNTARRNVAECGSQSSGVVINGGPPFSANPTSSVEAWDGTSWTAITGTPIGGYSGVGIGTTSTSLLYCGGNNNPGSGGQKIATALEYNGTSWTSISDMGTVREAGMGAARGSTTAGLMYGGETPPGPTANTELWDGSSWTELNNLNDAQSGGGGLGNSTQALSYGGTRPGAPPYQSTKNEFWNGTSWTEVNDLATGRSSGIAPAGGGALGLVSGGQSNPSTQSTASEEWTADNTLSTVTVS